jgi:YHS domain-containing protein
MAMLGWIIRLLLLLLLIRLVMSLVAGVVRGLRGAGSPNAARAGRTGRAAQPVPLVKDPECGTFVVPDKALVSRSLGAPQYFCSEACRRQFEQRHAGSRPA